MTDKIIREAILSPPDRASLESIAQQFVTIVGGSAAMAKLLHDEYTLAEAGSPIRARVLEMVLRAFTKLEGKINPDDLDRFNDADIDRILNERLRVIAERMDGKAKVGQAEDSSKSV